MEDIVQQAAFNLLSRADIAGVSNLYSVHIQDAAKTEQRIFTRSAGRETVGEVWEENDPEGLEQSVLAAELKGVIQRAIDSLDAKHRYVYVETQIKGRSYEELARETGEKIGTLLSRKSRAAAKIKEIVNDYLKEDKGNEKG